MQALATVLQGCLHAMASWGGGALSGGQKGASSRFSRLVGSLQSSSEPRGEPGAPARAHKSRDSSRERPRGEPEVPAGRGAEEELEGGASEDEEEL